MWSIRSETIIHEKSRDPLFKPPQYSELGHNLKVSPAKSGWRIFEVGEVGDSLADYRLQMVGARLKLDKGDTVSQIYPPHLELCSLGKRGWGNCEVGRRM